MIRDQHGYELTGASAKAAESFQNAARAYHCYAGDAIGAVDAALADSPGFVMAHVLKAWMLLLGGNLEMQMAGLASFEAAKTLGGTSREQGHLAALGSLVAGDIRGAGRILEDLSIAHPHDLLALQAGQLCDFVIGDSRMLRDRSARVMPAWSAKVPGYHAVLAMHAFGLEEMGQYERAEAAGREAVALEPRDNWAQHAVAHVLEMQDRRAEGVRWMTVENTAWQPESLLSVHNWWHLALFHLGLGQIDEVLALYDGPIYGARSDGAMDMEDAAAMLWRLSLRGIDVGDRWQTLADVYETQPRGQYAFDDAHAMMAFVSAGRTEAAQGVLEAQTAALAAPGDNAYATAEVGLPLIQAVNAFAAGDFARTVEILRGVRNKAARFGGSHAQRDLIDLTLIEAASRAGEESLARALLAERDLARPLANAPQRRLAA
jgi:tetratricopeptide (TPR) repeat protein